MLVHDDLLDVLVRERVLTRRVVDQERRAAHDRREVAVAHREDLVTAAADADMAERLGVPRFDDAVDVDAVRGAVVAGDKGLAALFAHRHRYYVGRFRNSRVNAYSFSRSSFSTGRSP